MTGFIRGLFGSKTTTENGTVEQAVPEKKTGAFFLNADEAKTLGDLEYMRTPNKVRRTFPKTLNNPKGAEVIEEVSATGRVRLSDKPQPQAVVTPEAQATPPAVNSERRRADNNMDMFRNMAKSINKK